VSFKKLRLFVDHSMSLRYPTVNFRALPDCVVAYQLDNVPSLNVFQEVPVVAGEVMAADVVSLTSATMLQVTTSSRK